MLNKQRYIFILLVITVMDNVRRWVYRKVMVYPHSGLWFTHIGLLAAFSSE